MIAAKKKPIHGSHPQLWEVEACRQNPSESRWRVLAPQPHLQRPILGAMAGLLLPCLVLYATVSYPHGRVLQMQTWKFAPSPA